MSSFPKYSNTQQTCWSCLDNGNQPLAPRPKPKMRMLLENEMKEVENLVASDLSKLSVQERSEAYDDVHCVGEELQETEAMQTSALATFDAVVQKANNPLYEMALKQNRAYVENTRFRLMFLKANKYDVNKSVWQFISFLNQKALYFGEDALTRDITMEDLNSEEIALMKSGFYHIQSEGDRMGRVVMVCFKNKLSQRWAHVGLMCRVVYYITFNILLSMPGVQSKGIVTIQLNAKNLDAPPVKPDFGFIHAVSKMSNSLPLRCSALHSCFDTLTGTAAIDKAILGIWHHCVPAYTRSRIQLHCCSSMELMYKLRGYGIDMITFPVAPTGETRRNILNVWFNDHQRATALATGSTLALPGRIFEQDVLLGRGRSVQAHPGNVRFRKFLVARQNEYEQSPRFMRHAVAAQMVRTLIADGVRFLHLSENGVWEESEFKDAEKKVGQYFRELRKTQRNKQKKESSLPREER